MRKIKFKLLTQNELVTIETNARTFGELKADVVANPATKNTISFVNNQFVERETKVSYGNIDAAVLPSTDCFMFVIPLKTKSGALPTVEEISEMGYNELRQLGSKLNKENKAGLDLSGKRNELFDTIADWIKDQEEEECCDAEENTPGYWLDQIVSAVEQLKGMSFSASPTPEEPTALKITLSQLEDEAQALRKLLN